MNLFCLNKFYDNEEIVVVVLGIFNGRNVAGYLSLFSSLLLCVCVCGLRAYIKFKKFPLLTGARALNQLILKLRFWAGEALLIRNAANVFQFPGRHSLTTQTLAVVAFFQSSAGQDFSSSAGPRSGRSGLCFAEPSQLHFT